jgi:hypothetical protein
MRALGSPMRPLKLRIPSRGGDRSADIYLERFAASWACALSSQDRVLPVSGAARMTERLPDEGHILTLGRCAFCRTDRMSLPN